MSCRGSIVKTLEFYPVNLGSHPAVRSRLLHFFGHIGRADSSQDHSRALYASTTGLPKHWRRRPGHPRQTCLRTIENDLRPLNLGLATAQRRAQNRTAWQALVETATSLMMMMMMMMSPYEYWWQQEGQTAKIAPVLQINSTLHMAHLSLGNEGVHDVKMPCAASHQRTHFSFLTYRAEKQTDRQMESTAVLCTLTSLSLRFNVHFSR